MTLGLSIAALLPGMPKALTTHVVSACGPTPLPCEVTITDSVVPSRLATVGFDQVTPGSPVSDTTLPKAS